MMRHGLRILTLLMILALLGTALVSAQDERVAGPDVGGRARDTGEIVGTPPPPVAPASPPALPTAPPPESHQPPAAPIGIACPIVEQASERLVRQFDSGDLTALFTGLGRVAGDMVVMDLTNPTNHPVGVEFVPGMVLDIDVSTGIQPIMLEQGWLYTLAPGETLHRTLRAYCLDQNRAAPPKGEPVAYRVTREVRPFAACIRVLYAGLRLDSNNLYHPVLTPLAYRTVVIQRSIWAVLDDQKIMDQARLERDLLADAEAEGRMLPDATVRHLSQGIWTDVEQTLREAHRE